MSLEGLECSRVKKVILFVWGGNVERGHFSEGGVGASSDESDIDEALEDHGEMALGPQFHTLGTQSVKNLVARLGAVAQDLHEVTAGGAAFGLCGHGFAVGDITRSSVDTGIFDAAVAEIATPSAQPNRRK